MVKKRKLPDDFIAQGLWAFENITFDPHNSRAVRILFANKAGDLHKKQIMDAIHAWMTAQKIIHDHGGTLTPEQALAVVTKPEEPSGT